MATRRIRTVPPALQATARVPRTRPSPAPSPTAPSPSKAIAPPPAQEAPQEPRSGEVDYAAVVVRYMGKIRNPMTAIRARCIQCTNGQVSEVKLCPCETCALHPFRMGKNIFHKRTKAAMDRDAAAEGDEDGED